MKAIKMKICRRLKFTALILAVGLVAPAVTGLAYYFPEPAPTQDWDILWGYLFFNGTPFAPSGGEVAAYDQGGTLRFRSSTAGDGYQLSSFWGPPTGSVSPYDMSWLIFDGSITVYAAVVIPDQAWEWTGGGGTYRLDLQFGEVLMVIPEPSTLLVLGVLAASGAAFFKMKKRGED